MKTLQQISDEITIWADKNFAYRPHTPALGLLEEVGEAAHVELKSRQKIRGYDDPHKRKVDLIDAYADAAIYALHFIGVNKLAAPSQIHSVAETDMDKLFGSLAYAAGAMLSSHRDLAMNNIPVLFDLLNTLAARENVNLLDLIRDTWARVSQRDWTKSPTNAHEVAE